MGYVLGLFLCLLSGQWWAIPVVIALVSWLNSTEHEIKVEIETSVPASPWGVLARMAAVCVVVAAFFYVLLAVWVMGEL